MESVATARGEQILIYKLSHTWFGMLKLPEGAMSTRKGNVIRLIDLLDEAKKEHVVVKKNLRNTQTRRRMQSPRPLVLVLYDMPICHRIHRAMSHLVGTNALLGWKYGTISHVWLARGKGYTKKVGVTRSKR